MKREDFMARVHELAELLGGRLYTLVAKQSEAVRATALHEAKERMLAELGDDQVAPERRGSKKRKQQRCSKCQSTEHNARRCDAEVEEVEAEAPDDDEDKPAIASPPTTSAGADRFARLEEASARRGAAGRLDARGRPT